MLPCAATQPLTTAPRALQALASPSADDDAAAAAGGGSTAPPAEPVSAAPPFPTQPAGTGHSCRVDSVLALPGSRVATKSADGRVVVWATSRDAAGALSARQTTTLRVPGCAAGDGARGRLGATRDGGVLVGGSSTGDVFAFDAATGERLAAFNTGKVRAHVAAAAVTLDGRNVLAAVGNGIVARWELIDAAPAGAAPAGDADDAME